MEVAKEIERAEPGLVSRGLHFLSVAGLGMALATYFFNLWVSRRVPSLSADSLIYHLTIPVYWRERGFLQTPDLPFHDGAAEHSPLFTETIIYGLMGLTGNDDLAFLVQPAFFLLLVGVFYCSMRQLGLSPIAGRFLTALVLLFAPFFHSSLIVNSEIVMTCGVALFVYGMLQTRERREAGWYVAAAGIALTLAAKTVGVIYGSLAVVILVGALAAERSTEFAEGRRLSFRITAICLAIILCGLAFHFRNLWEHGNPLYPAELRVLGMRILPGRYDSSVLRNHGWAPAALGKMLLWDTESYAMTKQFGGILWLALGVTLGMLALRRLRREDLLPTVLFVFYPLASVLVYFAVVPFWSEHRLLFPVYYLLWGGLGCSLHLLTRERTETIRELTAGLLGLAFVGHACFFLMFDEVPLWLPVVGGMLGIVMANYPKILKWIGEWPWVIPTAVLGLLIVSSPWWYPELSKQRAQARGSAYAQMYGTQGEAWNRLEELTAGKPAMIAYSGNALIFPLFGSRLTNRVVYVPVHPQDQPSPLTLTKDETIYLQLAKARRSAADEKYWLGQLQDQQVDYVLLVQDPKFDGVDFERTVATHNPEKLRLMFERPDVWIYAIQRK